MFDEVHFTGTINLGNIINAMVFLIGSVALYYRVKAEMLKHEDRTGEKFTKTLRRKIRPAKKKASPAGSDQGDQGDAQGDGTIK